MDLQILGIDAAVDPRNTGIAVACHSDGYWQLEHVATGERKSPISEQVRAHLDPDRPILLAIDAPLGWPTQLTDALGRHRAGKPLRAEHLFNRETDRFVREHTGLKPLDVGADRIARTAVSALALVAQLRSRLGRTLPLLTSPAEAAEGGLIEVYPAATLKQHGLPHRGYKRPDAGKIRAEVASQLSASINLEEHSAALVGSDHILDAALCVLAGLDFLEGRCVDPPRDGNWQQEGWIWFRRPPHK